MAYMGGFFMKKFLRYFSETNKLPNSFKWVLLGEAVFAGLFRDIAICGCRIFLRTLFVFIKPVIFRTAPANLFLYGWVDDY